MVTTRRDHVLFTFVLQRLVATIQHLGLGELPLARASASLLAIGLFFSFSLDSSQTRVGTNAREKKTGANRQATKEDEVAVAGAGATTSCVIYDVSPKRPNLQSSFLHVESR